MNSYTISELLPSSDYNVMLCLKKNKHIIPVIVIVIVMIMVMVMMMVVVVMVIVKISYHEVRTSKVGAY